MKNFDEKIAAIAKHYGKEPIFDGIVSEPDYLNSDTKILWILKEANSTGEDGSWDMRGHIREKLKTEKGIRKGWSSTFKKIIYVTNGILNKLSWNEDLHHPGYNPKVIDELKKIAYINIKKTGGGAVANDAELKEYYNYSKDLIFEQMETYNPDIIIFGGTYRFFKPDINLGEMNNYGSCNATFKNGRLFIDAYHPMYTIKEETYFTDILKAVEEEKNENTIPS